MAQAGGAERILHRGSRHTHQIEIIAEPDNGQSPWRWGLIATPQDTLFGEPGGLADATLGEDQILTGGRPQRPISTPDLNDFRHQLLDGLRIYPPSDTGLHSPAKRQCPLHDNRELRSDGSNLAAFLYLLQQQHPHSYTSIVRTVQQVAPFFRDFNLCPSQLNPDSIRLEWDHTGADRYLDAAVLSDGTLRFILLATLLLQPTGLRPPVIVIDDPDTGLHPDAIVILAALIRQAVSTSKIIVATQSLLLIDQFDPKDILVAERVDGASHYRRLDGDDLQTWLEDYTPGELWLKNVIGGQPAPE